VCQAVASTVSGAGDVLQAFYAIPGNIIYTFFLRVYDYVGKKSLPFFIPNACNTCNKPTVPDTMPATGLQQVCNKYIYGVFSQSDI
jgi:hypothetical protein